MRHLISLALALSFSAAALAEDAAMPQADVTKTVAAAVSGNALNIDVSNDALGGDPAEGQVKALLVEYKVGETKLSKVISEGATFAIEKPAGDQKLTILRAVYGVFAPRQKADVTPRVSSAMADNKLSITVDNDSMGEDPANGVVKQLQVKYTVGGKEHTASAGEGETLTLSAAGDGEGKLVITEAVYGDPAAIATTQPAK